jgi:hypothetical protein
MTSAAMQAAFILSAASQFGRRMPAKPAVIGAATTPADLLGELLMPWRLMLAPLLALFAFSMLADTASAQGRDRDRGPPGREQWELLGDKSVGFGVDRDVIRVGRREGRFRAIAFEVRDTDIEFVEATIFFDHGPPQKLPIRQFVRANTRSRPFDLAWGDRVIERIEMVYRSRPGARGRAEVAVFGLRDFALPPLPPPVSWVELGCGKVGIKPDRDSIRVGRREGRFSAIKLAVRGSKIELIDLTVVYERGPPDELQVRKKIGDGDETPPFDLRGERRAIDRVDLTYRQTLGLNMIKGPARVCVLGR